MSYNGWKNYETWAVSLWIDNDQGLQDMAREVVSSYSLGIDKDQALKDLIEEMNPLSSEASLFSDLLSASIQSVYWKEIVDHYEEGEE